MKANPITDSSSVCPYPQPGASHWLPSRVLAEQVFSRAAGAPLVEGNDVKLLIDAAENYPAWMDGISSAKRTIHFEMYIISDDEVGLEFADILMDKARAGIQVRLVYDWLGCMGKASRGFWRALRNAGVDVRCFNPPHWDSPFGWVSRDHRKVIVVDGSLAFVTGLCIGRLWKGYPGRGIEPWRDTGVEIRGPAVSDIERAFSEVWSVLGSPIPLEEIPSRESILPAGNIDLRVIATEPTTAGLYRLDNLIASLSRRSLWISDAYFLGVSSYVQALRAASQDGVDVRLMVPGSTDIPLLRAVSRAGYQPLLEAGVRVFEWNGSMMHAKTAVADGVWARVGSTNLNIASWMGNYELDVAIEDQEFAQAMEDMFLNDMGNCTEIVLGRKSRITPSGASARSSIPEIRLNPGSLGRAGAGTIRVGYSLGAALTEHRLLGHAEAKITALAGLLLLVIAVICFLWPLFLVIPVCVLSIWTASALLVRTVRIYGRESKKEDKNPRGK